MSGQFIASGTIIIGTVATPIYTAKGNGCTFQMFHPSGGKRVTIGDANVTDNNGWTFKGTNEDTITLNIPPKVTLYGICEAGHTQVINYIVTEF